MQPSRSVFFWLMILVIFGFGIMACDQGDHLYPATSADRISAKIGASASGSVAGLDNAKLSYLSETIEETYAVAGPYAVTSTSISGYQIFYPLEMEGNHPIITWGNGTAAPTFFYSAFLEHLASWGFVVIAANTTMAGSGEEMVAGIDHLIQENDRSDSIFYNLLEINRIGTIGHSQGGGGAINAATDARVTCTAPLAPTPGDIEQVQCPIFLVAGSSDFFVPASSIRRECYIPATAPTIFGIVQGMGHIDFMGNAGRARGYVTAWFRGHLQGDQMAQQAFAEDGELFHHSNWTVEQKGD